MKTTIQVLIALAQFIIALLIVMGILPIIALAWLMVATGALEGGVKMSNSEFFIVGLVFLVLSNVTDSQIFSVLYAVLAVVYITVSFFRKVGNYERKHGRHT